jgi:Fe-Mn family superoxide dismutase
MSPNAGGEPSGEVARQIKAGFGLLQSFKRFFEAAAGQFGSDGLVIVKKKNTNCSSANTDNPLMMFSCKRYTHPGIIFGNMPIT